MVRSIFRSWKRRKKLPVKGKGQVALVGRGTDATIAFNVITKDWFVHYEEGKALP